MGRPKKSTKRDSIVPSKNKKREGTIEQTEEKNAKAYTKLIREFNYSMNISTEDITKKPTSAADIKKDKEWRDLVIRFPVHILEDVKEYIEFQLSGTLGDSFETISLEDGIRLLSIRGLKHWKHERDAIKRITGSTHSSEIDVNNNKDKSI